MKSIEEMKKYLNNIQEEFDYCENKEEKLKYIIELGKELADFPKEEIVEKNKVMGCVSNVYITTSFNNGIFYSATSSSLIVKGYLVILLNALNGLSAKDVIRSEKIIEEFVIKNDLNSSIVPSRANVIGNIFLKIKEKANELDK